MTWAPVAFPLVNAMTHLVANHDFSLQPVFTTKWLRKVISMSRPGHVAD